MQPNADTDLTYFWPITSIPRQRTYRPRRRTILPLPPSSYRSSRLLADRAAQRTPSFFLSFAERSTEMPRDRKSLQLALTLRQTPAQKKQLAFARTTAQQTTATNVKRRAHMATGVYIDRDASTDASIFNKRKTDGPPLASNRGSARKRPTRNPGNKEKARSEKREEGLSPLDGIMTWLLC